MEAWLPGEARYRVMQLSVRLQRQLSGGNPAIMAYIKSQMAEALGGEPTSWRWESIPEPIAKRRGWIALGAALGL